MEKSANRREFLSAAGLAATASTLLAGVEPLAAAPDASAAALRTRGARFRALLKTGEPFINLSAPDRVSARVAEQLGFPSLYLGSSAMAEYHGVPDWGIVSMKEQIEFFGHVAQSVDIPGVADVDDTGDAVAFYRNVKAVEDAGIGCIHFADGEGAMGRVARILPVAEMVDRIHAAADARADMCISIRVQGRTNNLESVNRTIERCAKYVEAGADVLWVVPMMMEEMPKVAAVVKAPLTSQMFVDTTAAKAKDSKVTVMVYASFLQNIMQGAMYEALTELKTTGLLTKAARGQRLGQGLPADVRGKVLTTPELTDRAKKYTKPDAAARWAGTL